MQITHLGRERFTYLAYNGIFNNLFQLLVFFIIRSSKVCPMPSTESFFSRIIIRTSFSRVFLRFCFCHICPMPSTESFFASRIIHTSSSAEHFLAYCFPSIFFFPSILFFACFSLCQRRHFALIILVEALPFPRHRPKSDLRQEVPTACGC